MWAICAYPSPWCVGGDGGIGGIGGIRMVIGGDELGSTNSNELLYVEKRIDQRLVIIS